MGQLHSVSMGLWRRMPSLAAALSGSWMTQSNVTSADDQFMWILSRISWLFFEAFCDILRRQAE
jgi:hypothetical protein